MWLANWRKGRRLDRNRRWVEANGQTLFRGVSAFRTDPILAELFVERGVVHLERSAESRRFALNWARDMAIAARLVGREDLLERALSLVPASPEFQAVPSRAELEQQYAVVTPAALSEQFARYRYQRHLREALDRRYERALKFSASPLYREEVGIVAALLGDLPAAERLRDEFEADEGARRDLLQLFLTLAAFWYGPQGEFERYLRELHRERHESLLYLSMGLVGRELWKGFLNCPFPDY
jgi:hypothetical protein